MAKTPKAIVRISDAAARQMLGILAEKDRRSFGDELVILISQEYDRRFGETNTSHVIYDSQNHTH